MFNPIRVKVMAWLSAVLPMPVLLVAATLAALTTPHASAVAGTLEIQFSGLNLDYTGTDIFDASVHNVLGTGNPAESDPLTTMSFFLDNVQVGTTLSANIFADIHLANVLNIPVGGGVINTGGNGDTFGVDLLTQNMTPGWGLALNIDSMQLFYTGSKIAISVSGQSTSLFAQSLPFSLEYDTTQPISIVFSSANLTNVTSAGGFLTGFNAGGTGNLSGEGKIVPEPSTMLLAAFGLIGLVAWSYRKRSQG